MNTTSTRRAPARILAIAACAGLVLLSACGSDDDGADDAQTADTSEASDAAVDGEITVADAWSRAPAEGQTATAVYGLVTNGTDGTITAVSATSDVTDEVELHEIVMDGDEMTMREKEGGYEIPAGGELLFEPGGAHIMLLDIDPATYPGELTMSLTFDDGTTVDFVATVQPLGEGDADMDMGDHGDGEMDMGTTTP